MTNWQRFQELLKSLGQRPRGMEAVAQTRAGLGEKVESVVTGLGEKAKEIGGYLTDPEALKYAPIAAQKAGEARTMEQMPEKLLDYLKTSPINPATMPSGAWEAYKKYINPILWSATVMHSPVGSPMTSELKDGQYVPLEKPRTITEEDKRAAEGLAMTRMAELLAFRGGMALANKYVAPIAKPLYYRLARKTLGGKVPKEVVDRIWNKLGTHGVGQLDKQELEIYNAMVETGRKTGLGFGKLAGEATKKGAVKILGTPDIPRPVSGAIEYQPPYRPEPPMELGGVGAKIKPQPPIISPIGEKVSLPTKPAGAIIKAHEMPSDIERLYPAKSLYDVYTGAAGGTPQTTIGGEVGMGGLAATPPEGMGGMSAKPSTEPPTGAEMEEDYIKVFRAGEVLNIAQISNRGLPVTTDRKIAETFLSSKESFRKDLPFLNLPKVGIEEYYIPKSVKIATKKDIPEDIFKAYKAANPVMNPEVAEPIIGKWAKSHGFDAVDYRTLGKTSAKEAEIKILNLNILKTKEQIGGEVGMGGLAEVPPEKSPRTPSEILGEPLPEPEITPQKAVEIITDAIKADKPVRGYLEKARTAERAMRIEEFERTWKLDKGQKGYFEALKAMKGELVSQPQLEEIGKKLTQPVIDELYEMINRDTYFTSWEKMDIAKALTNRLEGKLVQPHHYPMLERIYGSDFVNALMESKGSTGKLRNIIQQAINLPKAVKASFDFSAPYRQSIYWMLRPGQLGKTAPAFRDMFKFAFSEKAYQGWYNEIKQDPMFPRMRRYGLDITDPTGAHGLSAKEEMFMTDLPKIITEHPVLKYTPIGWAAQGIRISERAFTGFQNKLRFDIAKDLFLDEIKNGHTPGDLESERAFKSIAKYVNSTTGRGDIGRLGAIGAELNASFWSPRFIKARLDMFNPVFYKQLHPSIRKKLILGWAEALGTGATLLTLAALAGKKAGVKVELDPRSSDFGKLRIGRTRWDIWGGHQQYVRVAAQLFAGSRKTTTGKIRKLGKKEWPFETRFDVLKNFGRGKLAPIPQLAWEIAEGQKMYGGEITPLKTIRDLFIPMVVQDIAEAYEEYGANALWSVGVPATFGVGVQTYEERGTRESNTDNYKKFQQLRNR